MNSIQALKFKNILILIPVFNDWQSLSKLLFLLDDSLKDSAINIEVFIADDFSTQEAFHIIKKHDYQRIRNIYTLRLRRNLGHQRAIAVGLSFIHCNLECNAVIVMDGDGEDNPYEIDKMIAVAEQSENSKIIFARRSKRSEGFIFRISYFFYKKVFSALTGKNISVGNFSFIPVNLLKNLVVISEIWNHYSSAIFRSKIPYIEIDIPRSKRLAGKSKMNLVSLITHGLSSIAVYGDIVGTRLILATVLLLAIVLICIVAVIIIRFFTIWAIPGWATYSAGLLVVFLFQLILIGTVFSMMILSSRSEPNFIPVRDYSFFVDSFTKLD